MRPMLPWIAAGAACTLTAPAFADDPNVAFWLTIAHNNDGESELIGDDFGGVDRFKTAVDGIRAAAPTSPAGGAVAVNAGDTFLAGPEFNASLNMGPPFFDTTAIELIGYEIACIGNHEFDFGPDVFADFLSGFSAGQGPTFLSANLDFTNEAGLQALVNAGRIASSTTLTIDGEQVGFIGLTTTTLPFVSTPRDTIINTDLSAIVQAEVDALTNNGVNKIIVVSHLQGIDEEAALAAQVTGVDAYIAGGGDQLLANAGDLLIPGDSAVGDYPFVTQDFGGNDVPIVTTPGDYQYLGRLELGFDAAGNVVCIGDGSGMNRVSGIAPDAVAGDPTVQAAVIDPLTIALDAQMTNIVYQTEVGLDGIRNNIRGLETNLGNLIADSMLDAAQDIGPSLGAPAADVALANGGGIRNNNIIPIGDVSEFTNFGILPFGNFVVTVPNIPASQFKEILENCVSRIGTGSGTGRYAQVAGFRMWVDLNETAQVLDSDANVTTPGTRVRRVELDDGTLIVDAGTLVPGAPSVNIATANFIANGGDQYPFRGAPFTSMGLTYDLALQQYIQDDLGGLVELCDYPGGGEGRVRIIDGVTAEGQCPLDYDLNGARNIDDVDAFVKLYLVGSLAADLDQDDDLDMDDIDTFVTTFLTACP